MYNVTVAYKLKYDSCSSVINTVVSFIMVYLVCAAISMSKDVITKLFMLSKNERK